MVLPSTLASPAPTLESTVAERRRTAPRSPAVERAKRHLAAVGEPTIEERFATGPEEPAAVAEALATALMDHYRRTRDEQTFGLLVDLAGPALHRRIRYRLRQLGLRRDPDEVAQDVLVNVYRYPDRFDAIRPAAFRAWSSRIVDNAIRRQLRDERAGPELQLHGTDDLARERDDRAAEPSTQAENAEECARALQALGLLLQCYLSAYHELGERERFVLQMVELRGTRYGELAAALGIRPEALKMVVFRARKRIHEKLTVIFSRARTATAA